MRSLERTHRPRESEIDLVIDQSRPRCREGQRRECEEARAVAHGPMRYGVITCQVPPCPPNKAVANQRRDDDDSEGGCQMPNGKQLADRSGHNAKKAQRDECSGYSQVPPHASSLS